MSSKLNVSEIIIGHFKTLSNSQGEIVKTDIFVFYIIPVLLAIFSIYLSCNLQKDISALLVNFGAIFTALLLSVLVLVYDQESKIEQIRSSDSLYLVKKRLLRDLYYNISYSILSSIFLVLLCFIHRVVDGLSSQIHIFSFYFEFKYDVYLATPLVVFITTNIFLNIIMVVKRMHVLLTTHHNV